MNAPENHAQFYDKTISDCLKLMDKGIWDISTARFEAWTQQFLTKEERFFSACLLDSLTLRTTAQLESCLKSLFRGNLNSRIYADKYDGALVQDLKSPKDINIKIVPVICETDPPTKSGPLVLRRLQRALGLNTKKMCWPWQTHTPERQASTVIFIDDFLGSGEQFCNFFKQWDFHESLESTSYYYVPVVAHKNGIKRISNDYPGIIVCTAEQLEDDNCFFSEENWKRLTKGEISSTTAKAWYADFCDRKGIKPRTVSIYGVGDMSLTFGFSHSTPNNSLPILWYENESWQALLER